MSGRTIQTLTAVQTAVLLVTSGIIILNDDTSALVNHIRNGGFVLVRTNF
ncbi:hypothetical protein PR001_g2795 [Phytophthora rubi]|uniref:Uncharacterized protein n=1 Tax=Phytophthora rubi TaxID=129364 RepID=A0A6A3P7P9_9STRA|nr:hypothetical protein PR002_g5408 [Phytophthora rubi]KAE9050005.1 hypothetical protein PR001_g2795 [Phytophthora rubi]